ncbi:hypothetical protein [Hyphomonas sp.]|uniref:hypothetical protein n=1 Tax=Hyphomonas sp. TaxID=87 RepID=UPI0032ECB057|tara:strand:- start:2111 stop:2617 length:507 start_codon:yes stop_codon:yes gene_type:complete
MTRFLSAIAAICLVSMPALAEDVSTDDVYACAGISTDAERLACYDAAVGRLKAAEDSGEVTTITRSEVEQVKRDSFGFSIPSLPSLALRKSGGGDEELDEVTAAVSSVSRNGAGRWRVRLENGQVWVQTDDKSVRAKNVKEARIYSASLGSYKMKLDGGLAFRVQREQ